MTKHPLKKMNNPETGESNLSPGEDPLSNSLESYDEEGEENDTPKNEEEEETSETPEGENPEKESKELQSALAQKKHYRDKFEKAEEELKRLKAKMTPDEGKKLSNLEPMSVVKLAKALGDYSEDEVEFITRNANSDSPDDIIRASEDEWVAGAIKARREKVKKEKQIPSSSNPSFTSRDKSLNDLIDMDDKEFEKFIKQNKKKGSRTGI